MILSILMWIIFFITLILVVSLDQLTKHLVIKYKVTHYINKFGPLGLFKRYPFFRPILWFLHFAILTPLFFTSDLYLFLGAGLVSAQLSNLIDRIIRGGAVDFIPFPTPFVNRKTRYNLADLSIAAGLIIYLNSLLKL